MGCGTSSPVVIRPDIIVDEAVKHYQTQVSLRGTEQAHLSISDDLKDQTREGVWLRTLFSARSERLDPVDPVFTL